MQMLLFVCLDNAILTSRGALKAVFFLLSAGLFSLENFITDKSISMAYSKLQPVFQFTFFRTLQPKLLTAEISTFQFN